MLLREYTWQPGRGVRLGLNAAAVQHFNEKLESNYSLESAQMDNPDLDANIHVITPSDMGGAAIASMTASAFNNTVPTAVAFLDDDSGSFTDDQLAEIAGVKQVIALSKAQVFQDAEGLETYVASLAECKK